VEGIYAQSAKSGVSGGEQLMITRLSPFSTPKPLTQAPQLKAFPLQEQPLTNELRFGVTSRITKKEKLGLNERLQEAIEQLKGVASIRELQNVFLGLRETVDDMGVKAGFHKPVRIPRLLMADAYTVASDGFISKSAKDFSAYQICFRRDQTPWMKTLGLEPKDAKYVFFGLQQIIKKLLHDPITRQEIDETERFLKVAKNGKEFRWNREMWDRIVDEYDGFMPLKIEAMRDGAVSFPGEPVIQITAKDGFGELAAWFETKLLQTWATSERATLLRYWLDYNKDLVRRCTNENLTEEQVTRKAQNLLADFSDRSSMTEEESTLLGLASLTSFPTSSTLSAGYLAFKESGDNAASNASMYSLAHRTPQSYEDKGKHWKAYTSLFKFANREFASYVADVYDFRTDVVKYLIPLAKKAAKQNQGAVVCARPDSGIAYDEVLFVLEEAVKAGLYKTVTAKDGHPLKAMTTLRVIQADGMNFAKIKEINDKLIEAGFSPPDCVYYGVGGYLHNALSRDNLSAAQKLSAVGKSHTPVMKSPKGARGKESIPGMVKVIRDQKGSPTVRGIHEPGRNHLVSWYDGIERKGITYKEDFREVQKRVIIDFNRYSRPKELLSPSIREEVYKLRAKYHPDEVAETVTAGK
jgi:nicotinamide phosphoribosyltransferase